MLALLALQQLVEDGGCCLDLLVLLHKRLAWGSLQRTVAPMAADIGLAFCTAPVGTLVAIEAIFRPLHRGRRLREPALLDTWIHLFVFVVLAQHSFDIFQLGRKRRHGVGRADT